MGKAATCPPRLMTLKYEPEAVSAVTETVALVGKGIVYDTGALRFFFFRSGMRGSMRRRECVAGGRGGAYAVLGC